MHQSVEQRIEGVMSLRLEADTQIRAKRQE